MTRRHALIAALALLVVLPLAVLVRAGWAPLASLDQHADDDAHQAVTSSAALLDVSRGVTHLGDPTVVTALAALAALALWLAGRRTDAGYVALARVAAVVAGFVAKEAIGRARPHLAQPVASASGYSFPSGHALGSAALYLSLALVAARMWRRARAWLLVAAVVISVAVATSRVLLGVHFPSDVVAGLILGWAIALVGRAAEPPAEPGDVDAPHRREALA